jgi:zinc protease
MNYTHTTLVGTIPFTLIKPLSPEIVRFAVTVKVADALTRFTATDLSLYGMLLLTKTKTKNKAAIEEYLKQHGIHLSIKTGRTSITYSGEVRQSNVSKVVNILNELIFEPVIDADGFVQKKKLALEANREAHDDAKRIAHVAFINTLYATEPAYTLDTLAGERAHISRIQTKSIIELHKTLRESSWYVSVVGSRKAADVFLPLVSKIGKNAVAYTHTPKISLPVTPTAHYANVPSKTNIEVVIGNVCHVRNDDPEFVAFDFGMDVLGKTGGFFGRLMNTVREKEGLTYGIYASTHSHYRGDTFHYTVRTFFMAKDYEKGITSTLREMTKIAQCGITAKELAVFKEISKNQHILAHESNKTRLHLYHELITHGYTEALLTEHQMNVAALTTGRVRKALTKHLNPKTLVLSAAGPISREGKVLT